MNRRRSVERSATPTCRAIRLSDACSAFSRRLAAATRLQSVVQATRDPELALVARLRLARVQASLGKYDDAQKTLGDTRSAVFDDVRGDVLFQKGDKTAAVDAWNAALSAGESRGVDRQIIELKVGAAGGSVKATAQGGKP